MNATMPEQEVVIRPSGETKAVAALDSTSAGRDQLFRRIMVGTDFSRASVPVFEHALALARKHGAELLIAHSTVLPDFIGFLPAYSYDEWETLTKRDAGRQLSVLADRAHGDAVRCHALVLRGIPEDAIIKAAIRLKADLIVIGGHRRTGLARLWSGCRAARLVARAPCSVLVVSLPEAPTPGS